MDSQQQNLSKVILDVIREVKYGISAEHIHQGVKKVEGLAAISLEDVLSAIKIESELGTIRERLSGLYCTTCRQAKRRKFDGFYLSDDEENMEEAKTIGKRKKKQMKKAKIYPNIPNIQTMETEAAVKLESIKPEICPYCGLEAVEEKKHLVCRSCFSRIHQKCLDYNDKLASRCRQYAWQCMNCKTCSICIDSGNPDNMLFCDACDKGYHTSCHDPKITITPQGPWVCSSCEKEDKKLCEFSSNNGANCVIRSMTELENANFIQEESKSPPTYDHFDDNNNRNDDIPYGISNIATWNSKEITEFFKSLGFIKEAGVFDDQEIDGRTLLLLKRQDVLNELSLKLGPALKIYRHVSYLQMGWSSQQCLDAAMRKADCKS